MPRKTEFHERALLALAWTCMLMACASVAVRAQQPDTNLNVSQRLLATQQPGLMLRLEADGAVVTGTLDRVAGDTVYLASPARAIPLSDVTDVRVGGRSTRRGAKIGAIIGAPVAGIVGTGAALLFSAECYDCATTGQIAAGILASTAFGALSGAALSALLGASVPRWQRITAKGPLPQPPGAPSLASIRITPALARAYERGTGISGGFAAAYLTEFPRSLAVGPEVGVYSLATERTGVTHTCEDGSDCGSGVVRSPSTFHIGGLAELRRPIGAGREAYGLLGIGVYDFGPQDLTLGGYSIGGGVRSGSSAAKLVLFAEARWHSNFTRSGAESRPAFYTAGIGVSLSR